MCGREDDIKIELKGIGCEDVGWGHPVRASVFVVITIMIFHEFSYTI